MAFESYFKPFHLVTQNLFQNQTLNSCKIPGFALFYLPEFINQNGISVDFKEDKYEHLHHPLTHSKKPLFLVASLRTHF